MKKLILIITVLFLCNFSNAQINVITTDIDHFWTAYENVKSTTDKTKQLDFIQKLYLDKASFGLKYVINDHKASAIDWLKFIEQGKQQLDFIRPFMVTIPSQKIILEQKMKRFQELYPDFKKGDIFFVIGTGIFGGRPSEGKVVIGVEVMANDKPDWGVGIVLHEFVHTQQKQNLKGDAILAHSIMEGAADFIAELVNEKSIAEIYPGGYIDFGNKNNDEVWTEFKKFVGSTDLNGTYFDWMYGTKGVKINGVLKKDMGYYIGYRICKSYYDQAINKKKAIKEIIELDLSTNEKAKQFLLASGYVPKNDLKFIQNLKFAPQILEPKKDIIKSIYGYKLTEDEVIFTFSIPKNEDLSNIKSISVAGSFNGWNPKDKGYQMIAKSERLYELSISKSKFENGKINAFKFVFNGDNWQGIPESALNVENGGYGNLTLIVE